MKTILEYYHELPEPYSSQAISAALASNVNTSIPVKHIQEALSKFNFHKTPQGNFYWTKLIKGITDGSITLGKISNNELAELIYNEIKYTDHSSDSEVIESIYKVLNKHI